MESRIGDRLLVAAIDFGTAYSGYAFSFKSDPMKIQTNASWSQRLVSMKTPTSVLVDPDQKFDSFGYDAESKYAELLEEEGGAEGWALYRKFKMILHNNPELTADQEVTDLSGKNKIKVKIVFKMAIEYLKNHLMHTLHSKSRSKSEVYITEKDVHFVITVPAIWDDKAKLIMREAAMEAGLDGDQLSFALESEAASIWCQNIPLSAAGRKCAINVPGTKYMVVDLGGGTADITVHESTRQGRLKDIHRASGGDWGGTQVDRCFMHMLSSVMGPEALQRFSKEYLYDFFDLLRDFETTKRTISNKMKGKVSIKLPMALREISNEEKMSRVNFWKTVKSSSYGDKVEVKGDKLRLDVSLARDMFKEPIVRLCKHIKDLLDTPALCDINTILLVGGFSECELVQDAVTEHFSKKTIIFPFNSGLAVLNGAVLYGHMPGMVESRISHFTYGMQTTVDFDPDIHPSEKKIVVNGVEKCKDVFRIYVEKGQEVKVGYTVTDKVQPSSDDSGMMTFNIYTSNEKAPKFVTDRACALLGKFHIKLPRGKTTEERAYERSLVFGDTEIMLKMKHLQTGSMFTKYFNFY